MSQSVDTLPEPDADAGNWSRALCAQIEQQCRLASGAIAFSRFMQMALYAPGYGYYSSDLRKFGAEGDFITAPEVSPLFAQCLARQVSEVLATMDAPAVLEFGAGSGTMAADMLLELERLEILPEHYFIVEVSAALKLRQRDTIAAKAAHLLARVVWLDALPAEKIQGVVVANEVLDAMPVECFRIHGHSVESLYVSCKNSELSSEYRPADLKGDSEVESAVRRIEARIESALPEGYCSEYNPAVTGWLAAVAATLEQGLVLLIDYGYVASEYYHPQRQAGTLMCHYQHRAHTDPLWYPGLQDITAFVDFSDVAYSAHAAGFDVSGFATQAMFLMSAGLDELHQREMSDDVKDQLLLAQQIKTLTLPSEMGERFKVMALTKNYDEPLTGFIMQDLRGRL